MADINTEELQDAINELSRTLNGLGGTAKTERSKFEQSAESLMKVKGSGRAAADALDTLGRTAVQLTSQIYKGQQGAKKYAEAVDDAATAVGALTFMLGGPLVKAITVLTLGFIKLGKVSAEMSDNLFKGYQRISRSGAAAADGLAGVFQMMQDFRLSTEELDQLGELFAQNAQSLALLNGTVYEGAKTFGGLRRSITTSGLEQQFMALGLNTAEINEALGGYIELSARTGAMENRNINQITASIKQYVLETDAITKLTGANRKQQEEASRRALAVEQFRFKINQLRAKGDEASIKESNRLMMTYRGLSAVSQDAADGFAQMVTGIVTEGGVGSFLITNGDAMRAATDSTLSLKDTLDLFGRGLNEGLQGPLGGLAEFGQFSNVLKLNYGQLSDLNTILKNSGGSFDKITSEQQLQIAMNELGLKNQVAMRTAEMNSMQAMQNFVNIGVNPATAALASLAQVVEGLTALLPGKRTTYTAGGATAGAGIGAAIGSVIPGVGTAIGAGVGAVVGGIGGFFAGGPEGKPPTTAAPAAAQPPAAGTVNPNDVFKFTGNTGSLDHFEKLHPTVKAQALAMGKEYLRLTGEKLQINSAFRSMQEQANVQPTGGAPKAAPGTSMHEQGRALDFNSDQVRKLESMGLLSMFGFKSGANFNDPQHVFMRDGGIATGPKSGYSATLHGTEAVVPLPDGRTIPVETSGMSNNIDSQMAIMSQQLQKLDELVQAMRNQNSISNKILQMSQA